MKNTLARVMNPMKRFLPVSLAMIVCVSCSQMFNIPRDIEPAKAAAMIQDNQSNEKFVLLDVRTPKEFEEDHIPGAVNIDYSSPSFRSETGKLDRSVIYLLYCRAGNRSSQALDVMKSMGFTRIAHIAGGITAWKQAGQRTISGVDKR